MNRYFVECWNCCYCNENEDGELYCELTNYLVLEDDGCNWGTPNEIEE